MRLVTAAKAVRLRLAVCGGAGFILAAVLAGSPYGSMAEQRVTFPLLFWLRRALAAEPVLDPRIKIFSCDDETLSHIGRLEGLSATDWISILDAFAAQKPRALLLDFVWSQPIHSEAEAVQLKRLFAAEMPIATVGFLKKRAIPQRRPMAGSSPAFLHDTGPLVTAAEDSDATAYGPIKEIEAVSAHVGQLSYDAPGWITPLAVTTEGWILPHLALRAARTLEWSDQRLIADGHLVPGQRGDRVFLNWTQPESYDRHVVRILDAWQAVKNGLPIQNVQQDDIVVILPNMNAESLILVDSTNGPVPAGYALVAAINSVVTGRWLRDWDLGIGGIAIAVFLACFASLLRRSIFMGGALLSGGVLLFAAQVTLFITNGLLIHTVPTALAFATTGGALLLYRFHRDEMLATEIAHALSGVTGQLQIARIKRESDGLVIKSTDQLVTVMSVAFVGFTNAAEKLEPGRMFVMLEAVMAELAAIVHDHGGVVDRAVGDGLMAYFGYNPFTGETDRAHADQALACAVAIQQHLAKRAGGLTDKEMPTLPTRIGLNTGRVHVGNVNAARRFDVTLIGHTVNIARRFEDSGETFKVLMGANTYGLLGARSLARRFHVRETHIKHKRQMMRVYECDPFANDPDLLNTALKAYRTYARLEREEERQLLPNGVTARLVGPEGKFGVVRDFSPGGICVLVPTRFFANQTTLVFTVRLENERGLGKEVGPCRAHVRWGRAVEGGFLHGLEWDEPKPDLVRAVTEVAAYGKSVRKAGSRGG